MKIHLHMSACLVQTDVQVCVYTHTILTCMSACICLLGNIFLRENKYCKNWREVIIDGARGVWTEEQEVFVPDPNISLASKREQDQMYY